MSTELKRFTVSITPDIEHKLDRVKQDSYYKTTQSEMIRDLILRGLSAIEDDTAHETIQNTGEIREVEND